MDEILEREDKKTALYQKHINLGAKMVSFAGYSMPLQYSGLSVEHLSVRNKAGLFDVSHMGEFIVKGAGSEDLLQQLTTNDVSKLTSGKAQYSCLTNENGNILDDLIVYKLADEEYMLVVNASNMQKDWDWISRHNSSDAIELKNISEKTTLLALQGPLATKVLQNLTDTDLESISYYTFQRGEVAGVSNVLISATGYTGSGGFELYFDQAHSEKIWDAILEAGGEDVLPCGLAARDILRLEMGYCLYGNDITENDNPLEAGLGWITKLNTSFIGSEVLQDIKAEGPRKKLLGLQLTEKGIPRSGYNIVNDSDEVVGEVRSGGRSPILECGIALGYVDSSFLNSELYIQIRNRKVAAKRVKLPFISI